jgi:hypothetical protein
LRRQKKQLEALVLAAKSGGRDVYYFDGSGFSLTPSIPYAWQKIGETIEILDQVKGFVCAFSGKVVLSVGWLLVLSHYLGL